MEPQPVHAAPSAPQSAEGETEMQSTARPPAFQLMAGPAAPPVQRQQAPQAQIAENASGPAALVQLQQLWAAADHGPFWDALRNLSPGARSNLALRTWLAQNVGEAATFSLEQSGNAARWAPDVAMQFVNRFRATYPSQEQIHRFMSTPGVTDAQKRAFIGQITVLAGQAEYLLGNILHQGGSWESGTGRGGVASARHGQANENAGPMISEYGHVSNTNGTAYMWCGLMTGYLHSVAGMRQDLTRGEIFWSPQRLESFNRHQNPGGRGNPTRGGTVIPESAFNGLRTALTAAHRNHDAAARTAAIQQAVTTFEGVMLPQPGDVVIMNGQNARGETSPEGHVAMVESYDRQTHVMTIMQGNAGQQMAGGRFDFTANPAGSGSNMNGINYILRPALENYQTSSGSGNTDTTLGDRLVAGFRQSVTALREMAQHDQVRGVGAGSTVTEMSSNRSSSTR
jgi:hypothetical protein